MNFLKEKNILFLLKKKKQTFQCIKKETNVKSDELKSLLNNLIENETIKKCGRYFMINEKLEFIETDSLSSIEESDLLNNLFTNNINESSEISDDDNDDLQNEINSYCNEDLNISFNKISEKDDGVNFTIDEDDENNKVVNLNLNLILEISDKYSRNYKPKELELNLKIPKSVYLLISNKLL